MREDGGPREPWSIHATTSGPARSRALLVGGVALGIALVAGLAFAVTQVRGPLATGVVKLGQGTARVVIAQNAAARAYGLQGRRALGENEGMLFTYAPPRPVVFERKTVPFALDVVFVNESLHISGVSSLDAEHVRANSPGPVACVVEVPGGWCLRNGVKRGDPVAILSR